MDGAFLRSLCARLNVSLWAAIKVAVIAPRDEARQMLLAMAGVGEIEARRPNQE